MEQRKLQEELLRSWMAMEVCIRGNRLLSDFSMNEMLVCNLLFQRRRDGDSPVTATELCTHTRLLKSQMNRVLNGMEARGLISRERSALDKREVHVRLKETALPRYLQEHEHVLGIVGAVCAALGVEDSKKLAELMNQAADIVSHFKEEL